VGWLFQELEDKALFETNRLLLALQIEQVAELRELGVNEDIIKKTKAFKNLTRSIVATDQQHKTIRVIKAEIRKEYTRDKNEYKNREDFIEVNYKRWENEYTIKLPQKTYIYKEWLKKL